MISASFGFSIESSAPSSSNHTPSLEEHPSKRRKTIKQADADSIVGTTKAQTQRSTASTYRPKAAKKSRQVGEGPVLAKQDVDAEDSFVAFVRSKKTRTKISEAHQDVAALNDQRTTAVCPSSGNYLRTRHSPAAAAVDSIVATQLVHATVSVSGLKRTVQLEQKKATKARQKRTRLHKTVSGKTTSVTTSECIAEAPATPRKRERKVEPEADTSLVHKDAQARESGTKVGDGKDIYTANEKEPCAVAKARSRRQPLQDSDVNIVVRSAYPEKRREWERKAPTIQVKENVDKDAAMLQVPNRRLSQLRPVESAEAHSIDGEAIIAPSGDAISEDLRDRLASKTVTKSCSQATRSTRRPAIGFTKQSKRTRSVIEPQKHKGPTETMHDEDIDWLFETQPQKNLKPPRRSGAKVQTAMHPRRELADVDLDGLLSEIASLANGYDQHTNERHKSGTGAKKRLRKQACLESLGQ